MWQHKNDLADGFTKRYRVHTLVWYELHGTMQSAIAREKAIKEWKRAWKIELIEKTNPQWRDLSEDRTKSEFAAWESSACTWAGFRLSPE